MPVADAESRLTQTNADVFFTLLKWHRLILLTAVVMMAAGALGMYLKPPAPAAIARILIKTDRGNLPITGLPTTPGGGSLSQDILQTETEFFLSHVVLVPVARALRADRGETVLDSQLDPDIVGLQLRLSVVPVPNTTIIQAKISAPTDAEAERTMKLLVDSYLEQHAVAYSGSSNLSSFFTDETGRADTALKESEDRLRQWQTANNVIALEGQITAQLATVGEFESARKRTEVEIEATRAQIDTLTRDLASLPTQSVTSREQTVNPLIARLKGDLANEEAALRDVRRSAVPERLRIDIAAAEVALAEASVNQTVARLKDDLAGAERSLAELRQKHAEQDAPVQEKLQQVRRLQQRIAMAEEAPLPLFQREAVATARERVLSLRREMAAAEREAEAAARERVTNLRAQLLAAEQDRDTFGRETTAPNPMRELLSRDLYAARARLTSLSSQQNALRDQGNASTAALTRLREKRVDFERLSREVEVAKALYMQNTKRLDDARVAAGLKKHNLTHAVVIEPAHVAPPARRLKPIAAVAFLGAVVGAGLGVAAAFALEFFNRSLRTPDDVEFHLGVPVLAAVPAVAGWSRPARALRSVDDTGVDLPTGDTDKTGTR
jgi:uncharacterized protein involved in exopolysaccharide biosynthesis